MNKKVFKTMIILVIVFLISLYILKIFFPEQFVMSIENEAIISIGNYIDNNEWLHIILGVITSFITYWLYVGAVTKKWYLNWKEIIAVVVSISLTQALYDYNSALASGISIISMIAIPIISNAKLKDVAIVFSIHSLSQILSTLIRDLPFLLTNVNYATILLMGLECYFWLFLFYLYFNIKGEHR